VRVRELWRYPVKSMQGERVERADIAVDGLLGDRAFAVFDRETGHGLTGRRAPELLFASARWRDGSVEIVLPNGEIAADDDALSTWLDRAVELRTAASDATRAYEVPLDIDTEAEESWVSWNGPHGPFHDSTRARVSLVSMGTVGGWEPRRFRANVVLDGGGEDALVGTQVKLGTAALDIEKQIDRCIMVTRPQPDAIGRDLDVLKTINRERSGFLAVGALVRTPGVAQVGDELR
jgi:hypothetical protein